MRGKKISYCSCNAAQQLSWQLSTFAGNLTSDLNKTRPDETKNFHNFTATSTGEDRGRRRGEEYPILFTSKVLSFRSLCMHGHFSFFGTIISIYHYHHLLTWSLFFWRLFLLSLCPISVKVNATYSMYRCTAHSYVYVFLPFYDTVFVCMYVSNILFCERKK